MDTWDDRKRQINLRKHGLDFAEAGRILRNPIAVWWTVERDGETRRVHVARDPVTRLVLAVICTERAEGFRIISFRRASRRERRAHERKTQ